MFHQNQSTLSSNPIKTTTPATTSAMRRSCLVRPTKANLPGKHYPSQNNLNQGDIRSKDNGCSGRGVSKQHRYDSYQKARHGGNSSYMSTSFSNVKGYKSPGQTNCYGITGQPSYVASHFSQVVGVTSTVHRVFKRTSMKDARYDDYREYDMKEFQPGIIIRAPLHEEDFNRTKRSELSNMSSAKSSHISFSDRFGAIYSEDRFLIVVAAFSRHYLAIPLYTYAGTGLKHKDDPGEYASIVDHRQPSSAAESPHILRTAELKEGVRIFPSSSVAHLAYPVSRLYKLHVAHQGRLDEEDTKKMIKIFQRIIANPLRKFAT